MLTLLSLMFGTSAGLSLMAPYFGYVFWFLEPRNIIARIRRDAEGVAAAGTRQSDRAASERAQAEVLAAVEELTDIISSSISGKDKIIASRAVDALKRLHRRLRSGRSQRPRPPGSTIGAGIARKPRLRRDGSGVAGRSRAPPHLARVEGDAPVPRHLQRGAGQHARHQLPDRDRHSLHRRGGTGGRGSETWSSWCFAT